MTVGLQKGIVAEVVGTRSPAGLKKKVENAVVAVSGTIVPAAVMAETMQMTSRPQSKADMTMTGMSAAETAMIPGTGMMAEAGIACTETAHTGTGMQTGQTGNPLKGTEDLSNLKSNPVGLSQLDLVHQLIQMNTTL